MSTRNPNTKQPVANLEPPPRRQRRAAATVLHPMRFLTDTHKSARLIRGTDLDPGCRSFLED